MVGIAALVCTGLVITLIILKFGRHSKFGMKGKQGWFYTFQNCCGLYELRLLSAEPGTVKIAS